MTNFRVKKETRSFGHDVLFNSCQQSLQCYKGLNFLQYLFQQEFFQHVTLDVQSFTIYFESSIGESKEERKRRIEQ